MSSAPTSTVNSMERAIFLFPLLLLLSGGSPSGVSMFEVVASRAAATVQ